MNRDQPAATDLEVLSAAVLAAAIALLVALMRDYPALAQARNKLRVSTEEFDCSYIGVQYLFLVVKL